MNVKLRRIEVFLTVVECGGFSAAADQLRIAQSAVSVAVKELERELGATLLARRGRGLELTESGRLLRDRAGPALRQLHAIRDEIRDLETLGSGSIEVAAPAMVTQFALRTAVPGFMARYPGIRLRLRQAGALEVEQRVLRDEVDLGVIAWREPMAALECVPLWEFDNVACTAVGHPLARQGSVGWASLLAEPQAVYPPGYHQRALVERYAAKLGMPLRIALEADHPGLILGAVKAGLAVTTLPSPAMEGEAGVTALKLPESEGDRLRVAVCWRKGRVLGKAAQALVEHLRAAGRA